MRRAIELTLNELIARNDYTVTLDFGTQTYQIAIINPTIDTELLLHNLRLEFDGFNVHLYNRLITIQRAK